MIPKHFSPEFIGKQGDLAEFVYNEQVLEPEEIIQKSSLGKMILNGQAPKPLTLEEAQEIIKEKEDTINRIDTTLSLIDELENLIEKEIEAEKDELNISISNNTKSELKRALRKVFGQKQTTVTYEMYKQLLKAKEEIEESEVEEYKK